MDYDLLKDIIKSIENFEKNNTDKKYTSDFKGFKKWICEENKNVNSITHLKWDHKENGRGIDSVINTLIIHLSRFAKIYSKAAILGSPFSTQEEFIYLINLQAYGQMSKIDLIKRNVQEKTSGMAIINRLKAKGWIKQENSVVDMRTKLINITEQGLTVLQAQMDNIRKATNIVVGDLSKVEKTELVYLLNKLNEYHRNLYENKKLHKK